MSKDQMPKNYQLMQEQHPGFIKAVAELGNAVRQEGPLDAKTVELIQLSAAAALRLEGAVHSHARRALKAGATPEELRQSLMVITSTTGFPTVATAMSWVRDVTGE
ncbi:carboxymuconolactone decarboxylase family protein [Desulfonatronospira sp.]|uniref:carboxymuconolactone decarboxylase family protein n=1 Tax=Desulfonatronospira sp. TaxID=1962951 RepID=UPI0025C1865C|nr:carboxymuconolactone decarboxylase family protein [Desulfonatronospira sp.]